MKKIIKEVDEKRGLMQVTVADERWYLKPGKDKESGIPVYEGVPSVTWICGFYPKGIGFYKWLAEKGWDEAEAAKQSAGDKGSMVHLAVEMILNGLEFRIDTKVQDKGKSRTNEETYERELTYEELLAVKSFVDWRKEIEENYIIETLANEMTVFSEQGGYAGTIDWLVRLTHRGVEFANPLKLDGPTIFLVDFKTSKQVWTEYHMQVSAYRRTIENGENPIYEKNENGTDGKMIEPVGIRMAILQIGYDKNKAGYKWTEIEDAYDLFEVSKKIWAHETEGQKPQVKDFPLVLSAGTKSIDEEMEEVAEVLNRAGNQPDADPETDEVPAPSEK